jgi:mRNA-degrading endonuclease RelE of RelBE toxin-antitoxin system
MAYFVEFTSEAMADLEALAPIIQEQILALLNQDMNTNRASYPQVSLVLGFKNCLLDNSYLPLFYRYLA